ncbi:MAG: FkbM family methyltransferase [Bacteroidales bacterium]
MNYLLAHIFKFLFLIPFFKKNYFGFYERIFSPYHFFQGVIVNSTYRGNIRLTLKIDDWIQQNLYFLNQYEEPEILFVEKLLQSGDSIVDVGANIGLYSLVASKLVGKEGKVYAFEPFKINNDHLMKHVQMNKLTNIVIEKTAVSDKIGEIELFLDETDFNNGAATAYSESFTSTEKAPSTSLDNYFQDKKTDKIRFIKIDIEGGEFLALQGMKNLLTKQKPTLLVEINPITPYDKNELDAFLFEIGYKKKFIDKKGDIINSRSPNDQSHNYLFTFVN